MNVFEKAGLEVRRYRYYDSNTLGLDFEGMDDLDGVDQTNDLDGVDQTHDLDGVFLFLLGQV